MVSKEQTMDLFGQPDSLAHTQPTVSAKEVRLVRVAFETGGDNLYDYAIIDSMIANLVIGQRVKAPFGKKNRLQIGFCISFPEVSDVQKVKFIAEIVDSVPLLDPHRMELAQWIARYYCCPLGAVLSAMVPAAVKKQVGMVKKSYVQLNQEVKEITKGTPKLRLGAKGRLIIEFLQQQKTEMQPSLYALDQLEERFGCGKGPFTTLERLGLIQISYQKELESPQSVTGVLAQPSSAFPLNTDQKKILAELSQLIDKKEFHAVLLHGVTGSGKTEVYMQAIDQVLGKGRQALVLVPEIALTPQTVQRFLQRFASVAVLHSGLSNLQRHQQWRMIAEGLAQVVVGARSAVFAPLPRLGLIVIDEEHETSYKQDTTPRYHGRDVAIKLAQIMNIPIILGSATPSLETFHNCSVRGHFHLLSLPRRVMDLPLPTVHIVDMQTETMERKGSHLLSRTLEGELHRCLAQKQQAILLLNRRGHSNFVYCPSCKFILPCPNCDVSLTYHKARREFDSEQRCYVMCHYCLHTSQVPKLCPICAKKMILIGPGTQKAEEEVSQKFPAARLCRVDSDSMKSDRYNEVMKEFGEGNIDILLGTQMIGKGLDFPNVKLVGVLNADSALSLPDFRSSERTFQMIAQVAGRCGRASSDGRVIVQTYLKEEPAVKLACRHDYDTFARLELQNRQKCLIPPYHRMARIILRDEKLEKLEAVCRKFRKDIDALNQSLPTPAEVRGPVPATISRIENYHRWQIILKSQTADSIQKLLFAIRTNLLSTLVVQVVVDVDPVNLL